MKVIKEAFYIEKRGEGKDDEFRKVGVIFERESGSQVLKLDVLPVNFTGWIELFNPREKDKA
jgi:hypothetical protein